MNAPPRMKVTGRLLELVDDLHAPSALDLSRRSLQLNNHFAANEECTVGYERDAGSRHVLKTNRPEIDRRANYDAASCVRRARRSDTILAGRLFLRCPPLADSTA